MTEPLKRYGGFLHPTHAGGVSAYCTSEDVAALEARVQELEAESEKRRIQLGVQSIGHGQEWMRANEAESKLTITLARVRELEAEHDEVNALADRYATAHGFYAGNARGVLLALLDEPTGEDVPSACESGWVCESHPNQPFGHGSCGGAGDPCPKCNPLVAAPVPSCECGHALSAKCFHCVVAEYLATNPKGLAEIETVRGEAWINSDVLAKRIVRRLHDTQCLRHMDTTLQDRATRIVSIILAESLAASQPNERTERPCDLAFHWAYDKQQRREALTKLAEIRELAEEWIGDADGMVRGILEILGEPSPAPPSTERADKEQP